MSENPLPSQEFQFYDPERQEVRVVVVHPPKRRYWLHALLFLLTLLSTLCVGARLQYNFNHGLPAFKLDEDILPWSWALADWHRLVLGLPFSISLLGILTAHELGHYVLCVRRKVFATWPFFIPAPTLPSVQLSPSCRCYWYRNDQVPCGGRFYHVEAYLSRRRNVESEVCEAHLHTAFDAVVTQLEKAATAAQRREAGRRRKRLARQRGREGTTAPAATAPTT